MAFIIKPEHNIYKLLLLSLMIATIGSILQITGGNWDITSHLLLNPETFFTPSHTLLYSGIGLLAVTSAIGAYLLLQYREFKKESLAISFRLLIIGSVLSIVSGPSDFLWHEMFGVDGLLSPTHVMLVTGMLINSIAVMSGLVQLTSFSKTYIPHLLNRLFIIPGFIAFWLTLISYIYIFALPISNGELFNFNLNPIVESSIALIFLPIVNSFTFLLILMKTKSFGFASIIATGVILITAFTNILPSEELANFLPFYLLTIVPMIFADMLVYNKLPYLGRILTSRQKILIAGTISGSLFYMIGYPMLPLTLSNNLMPVNLEEIGFESLIDIFPRFINSLPLMLPLTLIIGSIVGAITAILFGRTENFYQKKNLKSNKVMDV